MRLIGQEVDALAEHQLNEFAGERLLTGLALKCRSRPEAAIPSEIDGLADLQNIRVQRGGILVKDVRQILNQFFFFDELRNDKT